MWAAGTERGGSTPRGWGAPPRGAKAGVGTARHSPVALRPASGSVSSSQAPLSRAGLPSPPRHGGQWGEGLTHDDRDWSLQLRLSGFTEEAKAEAGSPQTAPQPHCCSPRSGLQDTGVSPPPAPCLLLLVAPGNRPGEELAESRCMWVGGPGGSSVEVGEELLWPLGLRKEGLGGALPLCPGFPGTPLGSSQKCEPARLVGLVPAEPLSSPSWPALSLKRAKPRDAGSS